MAPPGSRIITSTPDALRRPAKSQPFQLTHWDRNGEIYFGGRLEYHELQTIVSYLHAAGVWTSPIPKGDFHPADPEQRARNRQIAWRGALSGFGSERQLRQLESVLFLPEQIGANRASKENRYEYESFWTI